MRLAARDKILKAAADLFSKKGYAATATKDIARKARVNEATLFRVFGGKEKLFHAVIEWESEIRIALPNLDRDLNSDDPGAMALALANVFMATMSPGFSRIMLALAMELPPAAIMPFARSRSFPFYRLIEQHIQRLQRAGKIRKVSPRLAARALVMMLYGHSVVVGVHSPAFVKGAQLRRSDIEGYVDIWVRGVRSESK